MKNDIDPLPLPVNVRFGGTVGAPPAPMLISLDIEVSVVNPPVPEQLKPLAFCISNTVVPAVV